MMFGPTVFCLEEFHCIAVSHSLSCLALQLRERLSLMKMAEAEEEEKRRKEIASAKQVQPQTTQPIVLVGSTEASVFRILVVGHVDLCTSFQAKEQLLQSTLDNISRHRSEQNRLASLRYIV